MEEKKLEKEPMHTCKHEQLLGKLDGTYDIQAQVIEGVRKNTESVKQSVDSLSEKLSELLGGLKLAKWLMGGTVGVTVVNLVWNLVNLVTKEKMLNEAVRFFSFTQEFIEKVLG